MSVLFIIAIQLTRTRRCDRYCHNCYSHAEIVVGAQASSYTQYIVRTLHSRHSGPHRTYSMRTDITWSALWASSYTIYTVRTNSLQHLRILGTSGNPAGIHSVSGVIAPVATRSPQQRTGKGKGAVHYRQGPGRRVDATQTVS